MRPVVYLAGPINACTDEECNNWRNEFLSLWDGPSRNPMVRDYRGRESECASLIVEGDKTDIRDSDVMVAACPKPSVGTSMEIFYAKVCLNMKVCLIVPKGAPISPWLQYHSNYIARSVEEAVAWAKAL